MPVILLVHSLQVTELTCQLPLRLGHEGDVQRRHIDLLAHLHGRAQEQLLGVRIRLRHQQAATGGRSEGHACLQLGVVVLAGPVPGIRPAVVENVFALGMAFHVHGHDAQQGVVFFQAQVEGLPAGSAGGAAALFQAAQEFMADERVVRNGASGIGAAVPLD